MKCKYCHAPIGQRSKVYLNVALLDETALRMDLERDVIRLHAALSRIKHRNVGTNWQNRRQLLNELTDVADEALSHNPPKR